MAKTRASVVRVWTFGWLALVAACGGGTHAQPTPAPPDAAAADVAVLAKDGGDQARDGAQDDAPVSAANDARSSDAANDARSSDAPGTADAAAPDAAGDAPSSAGFDAIPDALAGALVMTPGDSRWENPRPLGENLQDVWTAGPKDTWAVGECGAIMHWDGNAWSAQTGEVGDAWYGVWGKTGDLWIVGAGGHIARHDGSGWTRVPSPTAQTLRGVWGASANDVWAVGDAGTLIHWNGSAWTAVPSPTQETLNAIGGTGASDVWAVGGVNRYPDYSGTVIHFDGKAWTIEPGARELSNGSPFFGVWTAGGEVWVGGGNDTLIRRSGGVWGPPPRWKGTVGHFRDFWGTGPKDVWALTSSGLQHFDGAAWSEHPIGYLDNLRAIVATGLDNMWIVGNAGCLLQRRGEDNRQHTTGASYAAVREVWASGPADVWVVGSAGVLYGDGKGWTRPPVIVGGDPHVTGTAPNDVWIGSYRGGVQHWNGLTWTPHPMAAEPSNMDLWAAVPGDVWAVGGNVIRGWNGQSWVDLDTGPPLSGLGAFDAVHGSSPRNVWVVGRDGTIRRWNGEAWTSFDKSTTVTNLRSVWVNGPNDVWIAGEGGTVRRWNGATWSIVPTGTAEHIERIRVRGSEVWATVASNLLLRWDGSAFLHHRECRRFDDLWLAGEDDIVGVGYDAILRRRGGGTKPVVSTGLPGTKRVRDLSDQELSSLCDYGAIVAGGYGTIRKCADGTTVRAKLRRDDCMRSYDRSAFCTATVAEAEQCARLISAETCSLDVLEQPACVNLRSCAK